MRVIRRFTDGLLKIQYCDDRSILIFDTSCKKMNMYECLQCPYVDYHLVTNAKKVTVSVLYCGKFECVTGNVRYRRDNDRCEGESSHIVAITIGDDMDARYSRQH